MHTSGKTNTHHSHTQWAIGSLFNYVFSSYSLVIHTGDAYTYNNKRTVICLSSVYVETNTCQVKQSIVLYLSISLSSDLCECFIEQNRSFNHSHNVFSVFFAGCQQTYPLYSVHDLTFLVTTNYHLHIKGDFFVIFFFNDCCCLFSICQHR